MANKSFVVQYVIKMREKFVSSANKVTKASRRMLVTIKKATKAFATFSVKARKAAAILSAAVTAPILFIANSLKNAASDAVETRSKFATVFRSISVESQSAADNLAKSFGLSGTKARELLGDTGDLLTGFGFTQESALKLSTQVNELAVDLASFTNFSGGAEGASAALTKALLGERESLKSLGVAISEKDVKAKISELVAKGQRFETLRQAKAVATLAIATQQSGNAIGDFARTSQDLANQERITSSRTQDLKESFGRLLLPIALKITKAIRSFVVMMTKLSPATKKVLLIIAGIVAVLGPMLLLIGSITLAMPALSAALSAVGAKAMMALGPIAPILLLMAFATALIIANWEKVSSFFSGFFSGITAKLGPTFDRMVGKFQESARIIADLFGSDSDASKSLSDFTDIGRLMGDIIGGALDLIIRGISGVGEILGQTIGAILSLDFSKFDVGAIKAQFLGPESAAPVATAESRVDVGVNVGLAPGLEQTGTTAVAKSGIRRADVGMALAGG